MICHDTHLDTHHILNHLAASAHFGPRLVGPSESANFVAHVGIHGMLLQEVGLGKEPH